MENQFMMRGELWTISNCGQFVQMYFADIQQWSGWYALSMFSEEFKAAANSCIENNRAIGV